MMFPLSVQFYALKMPSDSSQRPFKLLTRSAKRGLKRGLKRANVQNNQLFEGK